MLLESPLPSEGGGGACRLVCADVLFGHHRFKRAPKSLKVLRWRTRALNFFGGQDAHSDESSPIPPASAVLYPSIRGQHPLHESVDLGQRFETFSGRPGPKLVIGRSRRDGRLQVGACIDLYALFNPGKDWIRSKDPLAECLFAGAGNCETALTDYA